MNTLRPTKKQRELLSYIQGFIAGHGYGPSYREIMRALSYRSVSTVAAHINNLIKKGHLRKRDHSARSLEVSNKPEPATLVPQPITEAQEKWLVDLVGQRFAELEKHTPATGELDQLYVLVGALQILGFEAAATAYKTRLSALIARTNG